MPYNEKLNADFISGYEEFKVKFKLCVDFGYVVCIIGPNASGKTTILKTLLGLIKPITGHVEIEGKNIHNLDLRTRAKLISAVLSERLNLPMMKVFDVVLLGRTPHRGFQLSKRDVDYVLKSLSLCNIENVSSKYFNELSDGQKQKVLVARALAQESKVIVLDEPTTHLDPQAKHEVMSILRRIALEEKKLIILSTHDLELLPYCDLVVGVKDGHVLFIKSPEEIEDDDLQRLYNLKTQDTMNTYVHVFSGLGTGRKVFLLLWKLRVPFTVGPLHKGDVDYFFAKKFSVKVYTIEELDQLRKVLSEVKVVIDTGFEVTDITSPSYTLLLDVFEDCRNRTVITLRNINQKVSDCVVKVRDIAELRNLLFKAISST